MKTSSLDSDILEFRSPKQFLYKLEFLNLYAMDICGQTTFCYVCEAVS